MRESYATQVDASAHIIARFFGGSLQHLPPLCWPQLREKQYSGQLALENRNYAVSHHGSADCGSRTMRIRAEKVLENV
jgi:hypothetical protein